MGIGLGIARRLGEAGANVVIADRDRDAGAAAVKELQEGGWTAEFVKTDVSSELDVKAAVDFATKTYGGIDILVNNAGIYPSIQTMQMELADFENILNVNLKSAFLFTKAVAEE